MPDDDHAAVGCRSWRHHGPISGERPHEPTFFGQRVMRADADVARTPAASAAPASAPTHASPPAHCHADKHRDQHSVNSTNERDPRRIVAAVSPDWRTLDDETLLASPMQSDAST